MQSHLAPRLALLAVLLPAAAGAQGAGPTVRLRPGMVITRSVRIRPGTYRLAAPASLDSALVTVRGNDIVLDLSGVSLIGLPERADPDAASGVAVRVEGGRGVTIEGARIRGYKIAILARRTRNLTLARNDLSYNWKPRLYSLVEHESLVDWLSFHHEEHDEWLRYGAAIFLEDVDGGDLHDNIADQGMNGLLLTRCTHVRVWNNTFSFNSGLGVGLYRSSDNTIVHNRMDYDVRGYSHGFYRRGQDSAGLLVYEQSMRNVIAFNSATHGGDGFFLWAGQHTMDTGEGGANDNVVYANDFRFAPANSIEATFSRNTFVHNRAGGSDYGLWGGYSYDSPVLYNSFDGDRIGIGIEHGQSWRIEGNRFHDDSTAISVWADPIQPSDWGYPKHHDTRSRDYVIASNTFYRAHAGIRARNTEGLAARGNRFIAVDSPFVLANSTQPLLADNSILRTERRQGADGLPPLPDSIRARMPRPLAAGMDVSSRAADLPRSAIIVDDWGPFDYRSPKLWPLDSTRAVPLRLRVLGPPGTWRMVARRGLAGVSRTRGRVGDTVTVRPSPDSSGDWRLTLEYRGRATISPRGVRRGAGTPYEFSYGRFEPPQNWHARFFAWSGATDPRTRPAAFDSLLSSGTPLLDAELPRLDYEWYRPQVKALPGERWALTATTALDLPRGRYVLRTISDDAVRVWVDGRLAIDHWSPHESAVDTALVGEGRHVLRVEYYQVDGWTELRLEVDRAPPRRPRAGRTECAAPAARRRAGAAPGCTPRPRG